MDDAEKVGQHVRRWQPMSGMNVHGPFHAHEWYGTPRSEA